MRLSLNISGNDDDQDIQLFTTDGLQDLIAIESWHVQIEKQQLTLSCAQQF